MILKHSAEALTGEFSSSLATMPIHHSEAGIKAGTFKVVANHKPVLLVFTVLGLADADAVAFLAHRLVGLGPNWVSSLERDVASHLRGHWSKSQVSRSTHLIVISWLASKWRNW